MRPTTRPEQRYVALLSWHARSFALILIAALCLMALAGCNVSPTPTLTPTPSVDQSSPEAAVRSMYAAIVSGDVPALESVLAPDSPRYGEAVRGLKEANQAGVTAEVENLTVRTLNRTESAATVQVSDYVRYRRGREVLAEGTTTEWLSLVLRSGRWYVWMGNELLNP